MQSFKRILIAIGIFLVVVWLIGFMLPSFWQVQRSIVINAPAKTIFPHINSLKNWREWVVWYQLQPDATVEYSGPVSGVGATSRWKDEYGIKAMKIMSIEKDYRVDYQVLFNGGMSIIHGRLILVPEGGATRVVWESAGENGRAPADRYYTLFLRAKISNEFNTGLQKLKMKVEAKT